MHIFIWSLLHYIAIAIHLTDSHFFLSLFHSSSRHQRIHIFKQREMLVIACTQSTKNVKRAFHKQFPPFDDVILIFVSLAFFVFHIFHLFPLNTLCWCCKIEWFFYNVLHLWAHQAAAAVIKSFWGHTLRHERSKEFHHKCKQVKSSTCIHHSTRWQWKSCN